MEHINLFSSILLQLMWVLVNVDKTLKVLRLRSNVLRSSRNVDEALKVSRLRSNVLKSSRNVDKTLKVLRLRSNVLKSLRKTPL